jgi:hypothetical protein
LDGKLVGHCELDGTTFTSCYEALARLLEPVGAEQHEAVCILEEGFVAYGQTGASVLTLARRRGILQAAAEALGFNEFILVTPRTWQPAVLGTVPKGRTKEYSIARVKRQHGLDVNGDVADAINLGEYYMQYGLTQCNKSSSVELNGKRKSFKKFATKARTNTPDAAAVPAAPKPRRRKRTEPAGPLGTD